MLLSLILLACSPATVDLGGRHVHLDDEDTAGSVEDTDTDADTDTDETGGTPPEDTGAPPADTGDLDTGSPPPPCEGLSLPVDRVTVSSAESAATIEVALEGCATGVSALGSGFGNEHGIYAASWMYVPAEVRGSATATLGFTGSGNSSSGEMYLDFSSDQGDTDRLTLVVEAY